MEETSHLYADPFTSPFVRYGGGYAVFPPNEVRNGLAAILEALASGTSREEAWQRFVKYAWIGGTSEIHPTSTWHAVGLDFAEYYHQHFGGSPAVCRTALEAARLMLTDEIDVSWARLEAFLLDHIDEISGWSESWIRNDAEERHVIRRDDGTYWYPDASGTLIQIIGARTLPETRLDFITDSILRPWGSVRQVLTLFALVAVSEDFRRDRSAYPIALRAAIFPSSRHVSFRWERRQHHQVRTVKWRPPLNLCDPEWLAQLLAARVVDATARDIWQERLDAHKERLSRLEPQYRRQLDYILDSELLIGNEDEVYLSFEGRTFRWMNGTPECRATVTVGCNDDPTTTREAEQAVDRFLSFLVWQHHIPITKLWGAGGPRRSLPIAWEPRMSGGTRIEPEHAVSGYEQPFSPRRWLALALYREGLTSRSVFYEFLSFWKILELAIPRPAERSDWVDQRTARLSGAPAQAVPVFEYLEASCRDAIAHVSVGPLRRRRKKKKRGHPVMAAAVDPDNHEHRVRITRDTRLVRDLAESAIREGLTD